MGQAVSTSSMAAGESATGQAASQDDRSDDARYGLVSKWDDQFYGLALPDPSAAGELLLTPGLLWAASEKDAAAANEAPNEYLARVRARVAEFFDSKEEDGLPRVINHESTLAALRALGEFDGKSKLLLLTGPGNVGKSLMLQKVAKELAKQRRRVLYVDAREHGTDLTAGIAAAIAGDTEFTKRFLGIATAAAGAVLPAVLSAVTGIPAPTALVKAIARITEGSEREKLLAEVLGSFFEACVANGEYPVIFIDEANVAFEVAEGDKAAKARVLQELRLFTRVTKQQREASIVLATSEHGLPFRLRALGYNTEHISKTVVAEEVPPAVMKDELVRTWGCGEHLATALLSMYGGHVLHASAAVYELATSLEPALMKGIGAVGSVASAPALCLGESTLKAAGVAALQWEEMRARVKEALRALVLNGFVPLDSEEDKVAEILSLANVGCVVSEGAVAAGVPPGAWLACAPSGEAPSHLLLPSSHMMRLLIARKIFPRRAQ